MGIGQVLLGAGFQQFWNLIEVGFECHGGITKPGRMGSPGEYLHQTAEVVDKVLEISFLSKLLKCILLKRINGDIDMMNINPAQSLEVPAAEFYGKVRSEIDFVPVSRGNFLQERNERWMDARFEKAGYEKVTAIDQGDEGDKFLEGGFLHERVAPDPGKIIDAKGAAEVAIAGDIGGSEFISQWSKAFLHLHKGLEDFPPCFCQVSGFHD